MRRTGKGGEEREGRGRKIREGRGDEVKKGKGETRHTNHSSLLAPLQVIQHAAAAVSVVARVNYSNDGG